MEKGSVTMLMVVFTLMSAGMAIILSDMRLMGFYKYASRVYAQGACVSGAEGLTTRLKESINQANIGIDQPRMILATKLQMDKYVSTLKKIHNNKKQTWGQSITTKLPTCGVRVCADYNRRIVTPSAITGESPTITHEWVLQGNVEASVWIENPTLMGISIPMLAVNQPTIKSKTSCVAKPVFWETHYNSSYNGFDSCNPADYSC